MSILCALDDVHITDPQKPFSLRLRQATMKEEIKYLGQFLFFTKVYRHIAILVKSRHNRHFTRKPTYISECFGFTSFTKVTLVLLLPK